MQHNVDLASNELFTQGKKKTDTIKIPGRSIQQRIVKTLCGLS